jgi:hypothetical protein
MAYRAQFDTLRTLAHGGISGTYAPVGSPFTIAPRIICITNLTNGDMIFSDDSSNSDGKLIVGAGGFKLFDIQSNMNPNIDDGFLLGIGTQMYVKQSTAATSGSVYIELIYG